MAIKLHYILFAIRVPDEDLEVEAATYKDLVSLGVSYLFDALGVSFKDLSGLFNEIIKEFFVSLATLALELRAASFLASDSAFLLNGRSFLRSSTTVGLGAYLGTSSVFSIMQ
jgi:hypothetical protein